MDKIQEEFLKTGNRFGKLKYDVMFPNISRREYEMLTVIYHYMRENEDTKGIYISKLADMLKVSSPAVSRMVGMLEEKGYIQRTVDREDRRNIYVYLTESGIREKKTTEQIMQEKMKRVISRMGEEPMLEMIKLWNQFIDIMEEEMKIKQ